MLRALPRAAWILLAFVWLSVLGLTAAQAEDGVFEPLVVVTKSGRHDFQVEVMRTDDEQARGMMYRRSLADDRGMLFQFPAEKVALFWMKNTYVSLDMIFIRADGTVHRVAERAEPLSTRTISSGASVLAVLEVPAGTAKRLGIAPGDKVEHAMFAR